MLKQVFAPHLGCHVKFGRRPSPAHLMRTAAPILRLADLAATLPTPPDTLDLTPKALPSLRNLLLNASLGDCVIAGGYHQLGVATGLSGNGIFVPTDAQIKGDYHRIGGYVDGDPSTDNGCDLMTAASFWSKTGFADGTKVIGVLALRANDPTEIKQALYLFDSAVFGVGLPDAWISPFPSTDNFTWGVAGRADQNNGHCFVGVGYDRTGVKIDTWALFGLITFDAIAAYACAAAQGELYIFLTQAMINKASDKDPNGNTVQDICNAFNAMGGNVVVPPSPNPNPTPPNPNPGPGNGHTVAVSIDGATQNFTYFSKTNPRRPRGTPILYRLGNVTRLDGVVVDASHR